MALQDLTQYALEGFAAQLDGTLGDKPAHQACPHYTSSPAGMAWLVGAWLQKTGHPPPRYCPNVARLHGACRRHARVGRRCRGFGSCTLMEARE